jgi:amidohydrolase
MKNNIESMTVAAKKDLDRLAEIGWLEKKTTRYILKALGDKPYRTGFAGKKVGAIFKIGRGKNKYLLRSDIDGLKTKDGIRHICGHSSHTAGLIGAYRYAKSLEKKLIDKDSEIYFLFQPAEETYPSGAKAFIDEDLRLVKQIKKAFACHVKPELKKGEIGLQSGDVFAAGDYFEIEIFGTQVHVKDAAYSIDALEGTAQVIIELKKILKKITPNGVINAGVVSGGRQPNAVADYAILKGDIRCREEKTRRLIKKSLEDIAAKKNIGYRGKIRVGYFDGYPLLKNNRKITDEFTKFVRTKNVFGKIIDRGMFSFGTEDFSFIADAVPSLYAYIGIDQPYPLHSDKLYVDDAGTLQVLKYFENVINFIVG